VITQLNLADAAVAVAVAVEADLRMTRVFHRLHVLYGMELQRYSQNRNQLLFPDGQIQKMPTLDGMIYLKNPPDTQTCNNILYGFFRIALFDNFRSTQVCRFPAPILPWQNSVLD
jgi:hypothetical protein